jgi:hypothetical protein
MKDDTHETGVDVKGDMEKLEFLFKEATEKTGTTHPLCSCCSSKFVSRVKKETEVCLTASISAHFHAKSEY